MALPTPTALRLQAAAQVLDEVLDFSAPADATVSRYFRAHPKLGAQDRAFIAETVFGVLRRLASLHALHANTPKRLILALCLRYQGLKLDALSALAGDDTEWLAGLRGIDTSDWSPAVRAEWPEWLWQRLEAHYPADHLLALARALQNAAPLDLRVNPLKTRRDTVLAQLQAEGLAVSATPYSPLGLRLTDKIALNRHPLFLDGSLEVQDEGSQLLGLLLAARRGEMVVDFCAGAGGKTLLLGAQMGSTGRLYAFDISEKRLSNLKPRLNRSGLSNVQPTLIANESDSKVKRLAGKIDRVLVDAPCSGLGTLRRNPDLKWRQTPQSIDELCAKQAAILESAARLVKTGGRLVYATCSILPEENELQVEAFLSRHPEFTLVPASDELARQNIPLAAGTYLALNPGQQHTDGFFAAILERKD